MDKDELIEKWLNSDLSAEEKQAFNELEDAEFNKYIVDSARHFKANRFSKADDFSTFNDHYRASHKQTRSDLWNSPFLRIASVLIIGLGLYWAFFSNNLKSIETLPSQKLTVELPDHSFVELNALSKIEYNKNDWANKRDIQLQGEAFFKVATGKTFNVITQDGIVTVVGTAFNVKQRDNYFEVKCYEGIVRVESGTIERKLYAGDIFKLLENNFSELKTLDEKPLWTQNISNFEAIPIKEVLAELERQYNVEVVIRNIDGNRLFTGVFEHNNLENALQSVTQPMGMTFELSASNLVVIHDKNN